MSKAHWIQQTHLFRADEYICSECGSAFRRPFRKCPDCGALMKNTDYDPTWGDDAEGLSALFDDDW